MFCSVIEVDEFTRRLWNICDTVHKEGPAQVFNNFFNFMKVSLKTVALLSMS